MAELRVYGSLEIDDSRIDLLGILRVDDEGVNVFRVELSDRFPLYGVWCDKFAPNGYDFNVLVTSFGYSNAYNVGEMNPRARQTLYISEKVRVKKLVNAIFFKPESTKELFPFGVHKARFLGVVKFQNGWIN